MRSAKGWRPLLPVLSHPEEIVRGGFVVNYPGNCLGNAWECREVFDVGLIDGGNLWGCVGSEILMNKSLETYSFSYEIS